MDIDLRDIPGIGPVSEKRLARLGIRSVADLLFHLPRTYIDRSRITPIDGLQVGQWATVCGRVDNVARIKTRRANLWLIRAALVDGTGRLDLVWFSRGYGRYRPKAPVETGEWGVAAGTVALADGRKQVASPWWEPFSPGPEQANQFPPIPIYPLTEGVTQKKIRDWIQWALERASLPREWPGKMILHKLPKGLSDRSLSLPLQKALHFVHRPETMDDARRGRRNLAFREAYTFLCQWHEKERQNRKRKVPKGRGVGLSPQAFQEGLPFTLTNAQRRAVTSLCHLCARREPGKMLLQGDVGAGKTVVAAYGAAHTVLSGLQAALMVPTRLLAEQHEKTLRHLLRPWPVPIALYTGETSSAEKEHLFERLGQGVPMLVVGTHTLARPDIPFKRLSLMMIDEEHRFGVLQRESVAQTHGVHVLSMSATPIPRSLALIIYGGYDVMWLDEKPPGRLPVDTRWIHPRQRDDAYRFLRRQVEKGYQGYVIAPRIHPTEEGRPGVVQLFDYLRQTHFQGIATALLHGDMESREQEEVMDAFQAGKVRVLVATTIVEVGVDVPNATAMIVEEADRFGLAQLHQLRGRIGRGSTPSYALFIADPTNPLAVRRIDTLRKTNDGLKIAEMDLALRGPGEFWGVRQAGMPRFVAADLIEDQDLFALAREMIGSAEGLS